MKNEDKKNTFICYSFNRGDVFLYHDVSYTAFKDIIPIKYDDKRIFHTLTEMLNYVEDNSDYTLFNTAMTDNILLLTFKLKEQEK